MNSSQLATDNITEVLVKIIEFTENRQKFLTRNIHNIDKKGYEPVDLPVDEFSQSMNNAVTEHVLNERLVLCDSENIKFGEGGEFCVQPVIDANAKTLLKKSRDEYLEMQVDKLLENSLNQRVATELLKHKQGTVSLFG